MKILTLMIRLNGVTKGHHLLVSLKNMLSLSTCYNIRSLNRNESRGAHYKPDFPERNDEEFLKTTMANLVDQKTAPFIPL